MFMTVKQAAEKWGLSDRRVRILCAEGKIPGAFHEGRGWKIPMDAVKPADGRFRSTESLLEIIDRKKAELDARRPLTEGEVARLTEEFIVEYTYNSNAIEGNTLTLRETDLVLRGLTIDQMLKPCITPSVPYCRLAAWSPSAVPRPRGSMP